MSKFNSIKKHLLKKKKASVDNIRLIGNDPWSLCLLSAREDRHVTRPLQTNVVGAQQ